MELCTPLGNVVGPVRDLGHGEDAVGKGEESDSGELHVDELDGVLSVVTVVRCYVRSEFVG